MFKIYLRNIIFKMLFLLLFLLCGCSSPSPTPKHKETMGGRFTETPLYQIVVPDSWKRIRSSGDIRDTKNPIAEFEVDGLKIVIHNFPGTKIPPQAQISRWQKQKDQTYLIENQAFGGFQGLGLEGETVLAWALEPASCLRLKGEKNSDITIKATGSNIEQLREEIIETARSFEFVEGIPCAF
jgi:hypothetical protein